MILTEDNYVNKAEKVIQELKDQGMGRNGNVRIVSTSKLRNLLAMSADIYNDAVNLTGERLSQSIISRINYLKVRFIYEAGRDKDVRNLVDKADILACLDEIQGNKKQFILFSRYMEALVAYRKYLVEKDD